MKKYIHINRNIIQQNEKHGRELPVCRVQEGNKAEDNVWSVYPWESVGDYNETF
jgi:ferredoxin-thioredoxin reductase catalytic subunit